MWANKSRNVLFDIFIYIIKNILPLDLQKNRETTINVKFGRHYNGNP